MTDVRRSLPGVDRLLATPAFGRLLAEYPRDLVTAALRAVLHEKRTTMGQSGSAGGAGSGSLRTEDSDAAYAHAVRRQLNRELRPSLRSVINATGVILHTNLGRAPLAEAARGAMLAVSTGYSNLEFSLESGKRGSRYDHCSALLRALTAAEDALVVNNAAAALVLTLNTVASGKGVVVSRGELIEIGGGFRIPDIVERAGTRLVEIGTTNRTRLRDYAAALEREDVGAVLKVHRSNFRVTGFTEEVGLEALVDLARGPALPVIYDLGSGLLADLSGSGLPDEPTLPEAVGSGADVVIASGDKLLGGPQAGLLVGRAGAVEAARRNPLTRALRVDKTTLAALEATLLSYRLGREEDVPVLRMLRADRSVLESRSSALVAALRVQGYEAEVEEGISVVGGGTLPDADLPGPVVAISHGGLDAAELAARLRQADPPVVARTQAERVWVDLRTVFPEAEQDLLRAFERALGAEPDQVRAD